MADEPATLSILSDGLAAAVERAAASLVTVHARRRFPATGIAWDPTTILTSSHVVERDDNITVTLPDGTEVAATLAGRDFGSDIAILKVDGVTLTPVSKAPAPARTGQIVLALGRASDGPEASFGVVSYVGGAWRTFRGAQVDGYLRSDTTFYPGFSGGPLIDVEGRLLGLNSSRLGQGSGLTIPTAAVEKIVTALQRHGRISRGYLGITSQGVQLTEALAGQLGGQETGLLIAGVEASSPGAAAGLLIGDILVGFDDAPVRSTEDLQGQLGPDSVGRTVTLKVLRGGAVTTVTVAVGERPERQHNGRGRGGRRER